MGDFAITWLFNFCNNNDWFAWFYRQVTVISSLGAVLMLILNMAMNIHVTVRFLQLRKEFPNLTKHEAVLQSSKKMMVPILYTILTTICAFIVNLQWNKTNNRFWMMMTLGLIVSLFQTFFLSLLIKYFFI